MCLLITLVLCDLAISAVNPLKFIKNYDYMPLSQNPLVSKIPRFLKEKNNPDILVMGSSLPMKAISACDHEYAHSVDNNTIEDVRRYTEARYLRDNLRSLLQEKGQDKRINDLEVYNLTIAGSMASDTKLLLSKALREHKRPRMVIYGVAPRTFMDNTVSKDEKTAVWQILSKWRNLGDFVDSRLSSAERRDLMIANFWNFYRDRMDYQTFILGYACNKLDRSPTIYAAKQRAAAEAAGKDAAESTSASAATPVTKTANSTKSASASEQHQNPEVLQKDLALYDVRYNPPDFKQFDAQKSHLKEILSICKNKGIKLLVVAMPITEQNRALLDRTLYQRYLEEIPALTLSQGGSFLNLDDGNTNSIADFEDSVHTNSRGGKKVHDRLVQSIKKNQWL
ncbi:MAG: DUF1574 family protein [Cyanobacteriota/Melainabacteria group bacterium]